MIDASSVDFAVKAFSAFERAEAAGDDDNIAAVNVDDLSSHQANACEDQYGLVNRS